MLESEHVDMNTEAWEELEFLRYQIPKWGPVGLPIFAKKVNLEMRTDAGEHGFGGHVAGRKYWGVLPSSLIGDSSSKR